jgi:hypothetical protein
VLWIRITLMRIRIRLITLIWIRIQILFLKEIHQIILVSQFADLEFAEIIVFRI